MGSNPVIGLFMIVKRTSNICSKCKAAKVINMYYTDDLLGPSVIYDDLICLSCGLHLNNKPFQLCKEALLDYKKKYLYLFEKLNAINEKRSRFLILD